MLQYISLLIVLFVKYFSLVQCGCPDSFFRADDDTCLHIANPTSYELEDYCYNNEGSTVFSRPVTGKLADNLVKEMMKEAEKVLPEEAYLGMQNKAEYDSTASSSKKWHYEGESSKEFDDKDFKWWYRMPEEGENCAVSRKDSEFKALPHDCDKSIAYICEKDAKPCYDDNVAYMDYHGLCLCLIFDYKSYSYAKDSCRYGHLMHYKADESAESIYQTFYNARYAGGVYIGLRKNRDGRYLYDNGKQEIDGFNDDDTKNFDCGAVRIIEEDTLGLFTIPCDKHRLHFLCEIPPTSDEDNTSDETTSTTDESSTTNETTSTTDESTSTEEITTTTEEASR